LEGRFRTIGEAVAWCAKELGVEVSQKKLYSWFRRWGYWKKAPRPIAEKTEEPAQGACNKEEPWSLAGRGAKVRGRGGVCR
jgi:transposase